MPNSNSSVYFRLVSCDYSVELLVFHFAFCVPLRLLRDFGSGALLAERVRSTLLGLWFALVLVLAALPALALRLWRRV